MIVNIAHMSTSRPKSALASRFMHERKFPQFLASIGHAADSEESTAAAICNICRIASRAELDRDQAAAERFESLIVIPYRNFCSEAHHG